MTVILTFILSLNFLCVFGQSAVDYTGIKNASHTVGNITETFVKTYIKRLEKRAGWQNKTIQWSVMFEDLLIDKGPYIVKGECIDHVTIWARHLAKRESWALQMFDALGKPSSGVLQGKLVWLGDWDQCRRINTTVYMETKATADNPTRITGQYCSISYKLPIPPQANAYGQTQNLFIGVCVPSSCRRTDLKQIIKIVGNHIGIPRSHVEVLAVTCKEPAIPWDFGAITVLALCSELCFILVIATVYDLWCRRDQGTNNNIVYNVRASEVAKIHIGPDLKRSQVLVDNTLSPENNRRPTSRDMEYPDDHVTGNIETCAQSLPVRLLLCFSVLSNGESLLSTYQPKGSLTSISGIRVLSMIWIIIGHTLVFGSFSMDNKLQFLMEKAKNLYFTPFINATFSVDTFFVLGGIVLVISVMGEMKKTKGAKRFNWKRFYSHRTWRLTPTYALWLAVYVSLNKYWGDGPLWNQHGLEQDNCATWWTNLLYINNLVPQKHQCMGWSWYLATDMQFFVISPLMWIPLFHFTYCGMIVCVTLMVIGAVSSGLISLRFGLPPAFYMDITTQEHFMWDYYKKPWCRVAPYAIGVFTGYLLYTLKLKSRISRELRLLSWLTFAVLGVCVVCGPYSSDLSNPFSVQLSALYNALARPIWGVCIAWIVFACATGNGGFVNRVLSWRCFVPMAKLTYCAYLIHPVVIKVHNKSARTLQHLDNHTVVYQILGHICITYAAAVVLFLAFEAPFARIEKCFINKDKSDRKDCRETKIC